MAWTAEFPDLDEARETARKAMSLPIGLSSPLWFAFGAAASAGVAWWWATRWTRAVNVEAMAGAAKAQVAAVEAFAEREREVATGAALAAEAVLTAAAIIEPQVLARQAPVEMVAEEAEAAADDLTRLTGIGPKLAHALAERGVTTFAQLAAWTEEQTEALDAELSLKGRIARDAWVAQA
ncbi:MAG: helix-hairpin-helix domain-containing protein, partial [Caulobacteraceae bacterium]